MGVSPLGTDFPAPDFVALAGAFGAHGVRVEPDEVGSAVEEAFGRPGPTVVETAVG
jgi:thiamine pyrophosphate-dependent acetolactate synthase large subunit-like protein